VEGAAAAADVAKVEAALADGSPLRAAADAVRQALPSAASATASDAVVAQCVALSKENEAVRVALAGVSTLASCTSSADGSDPAAKRLSSVTDGLRAKLAQATQPLTLFLTLCPEDVAEAYLAADPHTASERWSVTRSRSQAKHMLSAEEEAVITELGVNGIGAFGTMYTDLSASLKCEVGGEKVSIAKAAQLTMDADEATRREAHTARAEAWASVEEPCAAALNAISGWRNDLNRRRGRADCLDASLFNNSLSRPSLDAMMGAIDAEGAEVGRRALRAQARGYGKGRLDPWDLLAPAPAPEGAPPAQLRTFEEGIDIIKRAVGEVHPSMADFVQMMVDKRWIEASSGGAKRPGAYCTKFAGSRTPRVYLSVYAGTNGDILTLAHELGHAYHNHVMADLPLSQSAYPMCLAETASIMFETIVGDALLREAGSDAERLEFLHLDAESAGAFLVNIPARFTLEKAYMGRREAARLTAAEFTEETSAAFDKYYLDTLSTADERFWQWKLHFYISGLEFYNWPYSFGYLFALGVYAQKERLGAGFYESYVALLRDTGRMSSEDVVKTHLGRDITSQEFWLDSIRMVEKKISAYEDAVAACCPAVVKA